MRRISEERTRKEMIDPHLEQAGWYLRDHSKVKVHTSVLFLGLQKELASMVARAVVEHCRDIELLPGRMGESERQVEGLLESLLSESFGGS